MRGLGFFGGAPGGGGGWGEEMGFIVCQGKR